VVRGRVFPPQAGETPAGTEGRRGRVDPLTDREHRERPTRRALSMRRGGTTRGVGMGRSRRSPSRKELNSLSYSFSQLLVCRSPVPDLFRAMDSQWSGHRPSIPEAMQSVINEDLTPLRAASQARKSSRSKSSRKIFPHSIARTMMSCTTPGAFSRPARGMAPGSSVLQRMEIELLTGVPYYTAVPSRRPPSLA